MKDIYYVGVFRRRVIGPLFLNILYFLEAKSTNFVTSFI